MSEVRLQPIVVLTGPTASGKSSLAVSLALDMGGEIVNADSMQVYRYMDVGTAKPTAADMQGVPHHLLDVVNPDEPFNAAVFRRLAIPVIQDILKRKKACFVVGGSGLYIRALLGGFFDCPESSPGIRSRLNREWEERGGAALHEQLRTVDPEAAFKIHPNDRVRVTRALEVIEITGRRFSSLALNHGFREKSFEALIICLSLDRARLYQRINLRSNSMMRRGLPEETQELLKRGYHGDLKPMQAIGYRHAQAFLKGVRDLDETIVNLQADTRRYAKRQLTWFRRESGVVWRNPEDPELVRREVSSFLYGTP